MTITDAWIERRWRIGIGALTLHEVVHRLPWKRVEHVRYVSITGIDPFYTTFVRGTRVENGHLFRQGVAVLPGMSRRKIALRLIYKYAPEEVIGASFQNYMQRIGA